jgi:hypothetical protein
MSVPFATSECGGHWRRAHHYPVLELSEFQRTTWRSPIRVATKSLAGVQEDAELLKHSVVSHGPLRLGAKLAHAARKVGYLKPRARTARRASPVR